MTALRFALPWTTRTKPPAEFSARSPAPALRALVVLPLCALLLPYLLPLPLRIPLLRSLGERSGDSVADVLADARPDVDALRIRWARQEYHLLQRTAASLATAPYLRNYRRLQQQQVVQRASYRLIYLEITPSGRQKAHLPSPTN